MLALASTEFATVPKQFADLSTFMTLELADLLGFGMLSGVKRACDGRR